jgi:hypothetical protein
MNCSFNEIPPKAVARQTTFANEKWKIVDELNAVFKELTVQSGNQVVEVSYARLSLHAQLHGTSLQRCAVRWQSLAAGRSTAYNCHAAYNVTLPRTCMYLCARLSYNTAMAWQIEAQPVTPVPLTDDQADEAQGRVPVS